MNTIEEMKAELLEVNKKLDRINGISDYTSLMAKSFHLGMVGGSGKNINSLNRKRERSIDKTIDNAKISVALCKLRNSLECRIKDIEEGGEEKRKQLAINRNNRYVEYWKSIKVGDKIDIGGNDLAEVTKKNPKSLETGKGCIWTVSQIIGKEAAKLL